jgi:hypothetical protein
MYQLPSGVMAPWPDMSLLSSLTPCMFCMTPARDPTAKRGRRSQTRRAGIMGTPRGGTHRTESTS